MEVNKYIEITNKVKFVMEPGEAQALRDLLAHVVYCRDARGAQKHLRALRDGLDKVGFGYLEEDEMQGTIIFGGAD